MVHQKDQRDLRVTHHKVVEDQVGQKDQEVSKDLWVHQLKDQVVVEETLTKDQVDQQEILHKDLRDLVGL